MHLRVILVLVLVGQGSLKKGSKKKGKKEDSGNEIPVDEIPIRFVKVCLLGRKWTFFYDLMIWWS